MARGNPGASGDLHSNERLERVGLQRNRDGGFPARLGDDVDCMDAEGFRTRTPGPLFFCPGNGLPKGKASYTQTWVYYKA